MMMYFCIRGIVIATFILLFLSDALTTINQYIFLLEFFKLIHENLEEMIPQYYMYSDVCGKFKYYATRIERAIFSSAVGEMLCRPAQTLKSLSPTAAL